MLRYTKEERPAKNKHSSLLGQFTSNKKKKREKDRKTNVKNGEIKSNFLQI